MTAQQTQTIRNINDQIEADCWIASQAAREVACLDAYSVLLAVEVKIAEGRIELAKAMVEAFRKSQKGN
jgi:hypothetical protein